MSLVYEALQKAEREKNRKTDLPPTPAGPAKELPRPAVAAPVAPQPQRNYLPALIVCVSLVALVAVVYIVMIAAKSLPEKNPPAATNEVTNSVAVELKPTEPDPPTVPANSTANDSRFKLTGIMKMGENFGAVINGHIVYDSQYVDGAIVKKVERDRVFLNVDGREIVVRLF